MSLELPILRLGHAGFSLDQLEPLRAALARELATGLGWELADIADADALLVNGARTLGQPDGTLRIAPGVPAARSVHLALHELHRPIAFATPLGPQCPQDELATFDAASHASVHATLQRFAGTLSPLIAQFCVASQILEQDSALATGVYHVRSAAGELLAVVDLRGDVGVLPSASPPDLRAASWKVLPRSGAAAIPPHLLRCSLSELMWSYALRTTRETLPERYLSGPIYFRRPPRLPQRLLRDSHLLLLRELAHVPATFGHLQNLTGLAAAQLSQDLGALYLVGAITSNPRRASPALFRRDDDNLSAHHLPSTDSRPDLMRRRAFERTAPAPMGLE